MSAHSSGGPEAGSDHVVERHSIDFIPLNERRGRLWHQLPFWFTGNFVLVTMVVGFTGPSLGLSAAWSSLAVFLGASFGTFFMALHANQGPRLGMPQMIQSRAQFGSRGVIFPFVAAIFVYVGFIVFDIILAEEGLDFLPGNEWFWYPALTALAIIIAVIGHDLLHIVQRWLTYLLVLVFVILTVLALTTLEAGAGSAEPLGWNGSAFLVQFSLAAGYNISYAVYVSDYSRYLPRNSSAPQLVIWTYLGAAISATWLMSLGAILSSRIPNAEAISAIRGVGDNLFAGFGTFTVIVSCIALITIMGVNAYGAMLTGASAVDGFRSIKPTLRLRVIGLVVVGLAAVTVALAIPENYLDSFDNFVSLMLYFLIPWTAVNLIDFYFVRKGRYAIVEVFKPNGLYGRWGWRGMLSYLAGFVVMIPFFSAAFYVGPIAKALDGADIAFLPGLVVSAGLYYILTRSEDRTAEEEAIENSDRVLGITTSEDAR